MPRDDVPGVLSTLAEDYLQHLLRGDRRHATQVILDAAGSGVSVRDLYLHVFQPTQHEIGRLWQKNEITVADEHFCTAATQLTMSLLYPRLFDATREPFNEHPIVVSAVAGELHELGGRMVADILESEGWNTLFLGSNTPADDIVKMVSDHRSPLVSISVTLLDHLAGAVELVAALRAAPSARNAALMVGGAAFRANAGAWRELGADATASDAVHAVQVVNGLLLKERTT